MENFKKILRMNVIKNCPVTRDDAILAEKIYGPDISSLKGKTTRKTPKPVVKDEIEIPQELVAKHHKLELFIDTIKINKIYMLTWIDNTIKFCVIIPLTSKK